MLVAPGLRVQTFLTVPEDCAVGVCAHEWGHLAARWADFYDTGRVEATTSNGLGDYCLMAGGSWGNDGVTPVFPNGMLRMFHGWTTPQEVSSTTTGIALRPVAEGGDLLFVRNPQRMKESQYIIVEYRRQRGQDEFLPSQGVAAYVVDEAIDNVNDEHHLAIALMQADGRNDLGKIFGTGNRGDRTDLYPALGNTGIGQHTAPALNEPDGTWSGVTLDIAGDPRSRTDGRRRHHHLTHPDRAARGERTARPTRLTRRRPDPRLRSRRRDRARPLHRAPPSSPWPAAPPGGEPTPLDRVASRRVSAQPGLLAPRESPTVG